MEDNNKMKNEELPMNWWNFWKYFRFPVGIFFSIFNFIVSLSILKDVQLNLLGNAILLINFLLIIFLCVTFYYFATRKKYGFEMLITYSIVEIIFNSFINVFNNNYMDQNNIITQMVIEALIVAGIICAIWVYPNYIYFKKRRNFFGEGEEQKDKFEEERNEIGNIKDNNEKNEKVEDEKEEKKDEFIENKKFCTKCGKQIENDWMFCNYCGNKL